MDINSSFARTLMSEFVEQGVRHVVVCPGSRSAPLTLAAHATEQLTMHVVIDERSAAFVALGIGKATGTPAVLICTSGTAGAHFFAAVLEASHAAVPMIVLTADRPPELIGVGAPQTIDQTNLSGDAVRFFSEPGCPEDHPVGADGTRGWRSLADDAVIAATGKHPGPVHLNLAFREPLIPNSEPVECEPPLIQILNASGCHSSTAAVPSTESSSSGEPGEPFKIAITPRTLIIAGDGAAALMPTIPPRVPIFADPLSGLRHHPQAITTFEALVRAGMLEQYPPDQVIRLGALPASGNLGTVLELPVPQIAVRSRGRTIDPNRTVTQWVDGPADCVGAGDFEWEERWAHAERVARETLDQDLAGEHCDGMTIAYDVTTEVPEATTIMVNSSLSIRECEWVMPRRSLRMCSNRGVNGIDGFLSSCIGMAIGGNSPVVGITGDLGFLHDLGALISAQLLRTRSCKLIVVDNDGGGIFSFLPPARLSEFETCFGTPHGMDLAAMSTAAGVPTERIASRSALRAWIKEPTTGLQVAIVPTDRSIAPTRVSERFAAVADALMMEGLLPATRS